MLMLLVDDGCGIQLVGHSDISLPLHVGVVSARDHQPLVKSAVCQSLIRV